MLPTIEWMGHALPTYGLLGVTGVLLGMLVAALRSKRFALSAEDTVYIYTLGGLGVVAGAKLLFLLTVLPEFIAELPYLFRMPQAFFYKYFSGGFVFYGGLIGGVLAAVWAARWFGVRLNAMLPVLVPALALAHSVARVGCFCAGCCYGVPNARFGLAFSRSLSAPNGVPLLPVQLYEAAAELLIFVFLLYVTARPAWTPYVLEVYILCYAPVRFVLEFFRGDAARGIWLGLSTSQWLSLAVAAAAAGRLLWLRRRAHTARPAATGKGLS